MELKEVQRKIRIRKEAYQNMIGEDDGYSTIQMTDEELEKLKKQVYELCVHADEYACHQIYGQIEARNRLIGIIKKVLRKICYLLMGWYYIPMIDGQVEFNRQLKQAVIGFQQLLDAYEKKMNEWKRQMENKEDESKGDFK